MSAAVEILSELRQRGVTVRAEGSFLKLKPAEALDEGLLERVKAFKPEILAALSNRPATCSASCYQIEPGRWIHHPCDGCSTVPPQPAARAVERQCWHCGGKGECRCITCEPGPCLPCRGAGKVLAWIQ